jgi:hypothetical protein
MSQEVTAPVIRRPILQWKKGEVSHSYQVSDTDRTWLARSLWREGSPRNAVAHTLLQRFAALYPKYSTLTKFLRAYVQPLNPNWYPGGYRHKRKVAFLKKHRRHTEAQAEIERAKRRKQYSQTPWDQIPEQYRELTDRLLAGAVPNPVPSAQHFCASQARPGASHDQAKKAAEKYAEKKKLGAPIPVAGGFGQGVNWFFPVRGRNPPKIAMIEPKNFKGVVIARKVTPGSSAIVGIIGLGLVAMAKRPR